LWSKIRTVALTDVGVLVRGLDHDTLERVERVLAEADFGPAALDLSQELEARLRRGDLRREHQVRSWLHQRLTGYLGESASGRGGSLSLGSSPPGVILLLGVNGAGKTTVAAKLAHRLRREGKSVLLVAADTYRAAAGEQLAVWASRVGVQCVTGAPGTDPAAVAFDGVEAGVARGADVVIVDTAGRLHTQSDLLDELKKVARVIGRRLPGAPHESLLVLDGTVGQNAIQQGRVFSAALPVSGLIITKLDSTARGGGVLALVRELGIPIRFIGVGEGLDDLEPFDAGRFVDRLLAE
jgi:fused signal recognition particle receptor